MKTVIIIGIVLLVLLAGIGTVSADVTNGDFESLIVSGTYIGRSAGNTGLTGWTIGGGGIDHIRTYWQPQSGSQSIDMSSTSNGIISQFVPTTTGFSYDLSFYLAGNPDGNPVVKRVEVFWGGASQGIFTFDKTGKTRANMGWVPVVIPNLIASSDSTEIKFVNLDNTAYGPALDNIAVTPHKFAVPELPTIALPVALIVGMLGAVLFIQKSKEY